jgi:hypothetical protein
VEPFGGTDDFSVVGSSVLYTAKDPKLPQAWHTKQNVSHTNSPFSLPTRIDLQVYIVNTQKPGEPTELTSGEQGAHYVSAPLAQLKKKRLGATHAPVFNREGTKAAWLELAEDGYESDKYGFRSIKSSSYTIVPQI